MYAVALFLGAFLLIEKPADVGMLPYGVTEDSLAAEAEQTTNDSSSVVTNHRDTDMTMRKHCVRQYSTYWPRHSCVSR